MVTMKTGKVELGQGTVTATMQLVADELDVPMSSVKHIQSDTWYTVDQGNTAGSQSTGTQNGTAGVRQAAAEARAALLDMASQKLGAPVASLTVSNGVVSVVGSSSQSVSYAALIGGKPFNLVQTGKATPKPYTAYKVVGTSVPRFDVPDKVFGMFTYTQDIKVPGMLHARVVRPPTLDSTLVSVDGFSGAKPPDLVQVVQKGNYVAVVAHSEWGAIEAAGRLKVTWKVAPLPRWSSYNDDLVGGVSQDQVIQDSKSRGSAVVPAGQDVDAVLAAAPAAKVISQTYKYPIQMHGSMGTSASTALVDSTRQVATVWSSTQNIYGLRSMLATALNLPAQNIHCIYVEGSGCYGQNKADDVSLDAAVISQIVGKPIRVAYSRADEHAWENYGQAYTIVITGAVDTSGPKPKVTAWKRDAWTSSRGGRPGPPANMASGILMGFPEAAVHGQRDLDAGPGPEQRRRLEFGAFLHLPGCEAHEPQRSAHVHERPASLAGTDPEHIRQRGDDGRARAPRRSRPCELPGRPSARLAPDRRHPDRREDGELGVRARGCQGRNQPLPDGHGRGRHAVRGQPRLQRRRGEPHRRHEDGQGDRQPRLVGAGLRSRRSTPTARNSRPKAA